MNKKLLLIVTGLMLFGMLTAGGCGLFGGGDQASPENAIEAFMKAMENQDVDALSSLTGEEADEFDFEGYEALKSYTIKDVEVTGEENASAKVNIELEEDGHQLALDYIFYMTKTDDSWFVTDADIDWSSFDLPHDEPYDDEPDWEEDPIEGIPDTEDAPDTEETP